MEGDVCVEDGTFPKRMFGESCADAFVVCSGGFGGSGHTMGVRWWGRLSFEGQSVDGSVKRGLVEGTVLRVQFGFNFFHEPNAVGTGAMCPSTRRMILSDAETSDVHSPTQNQFWHP